MNEVERAQALAVAHADLELVRAQMRVFAEETRDVAAGMLLARDRWMASGLDDLEDFANR